MAVLNDERNLNGWVHMFQSIGKMVDYYDGQDYKIPCLAMVSGMDETISYNARGDMADLLKKVPFTVEFTSGSGIFGIYKCETNGARLWYNFNDSGWREVTEWTYEYDSEKYIFDFEVKTGDVIQFKGNLYGGTVYVGGYIEEYPYTFIYEHTSEETSLWYRAYGNIMSMLYPENFESAAAFPRISQGINVFTDAIFCGFFQYCSGLTSVENLILPVTALTHCCYSNMFHECRNLTNGPKLPATALAYQCYRYMFYSCRNLSTAPILPATTLAEGCYTGMFSYCTSLTTAPSLPVTTLTSNCYNGMFNGCTSLTTAPALPATTLGAGCYYNMFSYCTSLTAVPELPATTLARYCYYSMFQGCTSLTTAPELPATTLAESCYSNMFNGCRSLTTAPSTLPATTLASECCLGMFQSCTSLTTAPELPATTLAGGCYNLMFYDCTSLTTGPSSIGSSATTMPVNACAYMFARCTSLTTAPELPAAMLEGGCYERMFSGCTNLNYIKCLATDISASACTNAWVTGVASSGTFIKDVNMTKWTRDTKGIPINWAVEVSGLGANKKRLAEYESGGTQQITVISTNNNWTAETQDDWLTLNQSTGLTGETNITVTISSAAAPRTGHIYISDGNKNDIVTIIQNDSYLKPLTFNIISSGTIYWKCTGFSGHRKVIEYKLNNDEWSAITSTSEGVPINVNDGDIVLFKGNNDTYGNYYDYSNTFSGSTAEFSIEGNIMSLINDNSFPILDTLASVYTFKQLFYCCTGLTSVANLILPATTLASDCYVQMFYDCTSLTTAPKLPATTLVSGCYNNMFAGCTSLTTAPELPATTLASNCYEYMFSRCTSLTTAPELPATTLANSCYESMFYSCTSLTTAPELPATTLTSYCYRQMFQGCTSLVTAPELPATTLTSAYYCYQKMFSDCTSLSYIKCLAMERDVSCTDNWVSGVASAGTFVKNPDTTSWTTGASGIPSNWTIQDAS